MKPRIAFFDWVRRFIGGTGIAGRTAAEEIILHDLGYTVLWLAAVTTIAVIAVFIFAVALPPLAAAALVGVSGLTALAAGAVGGMLGFLFGIPRTLAGDNGSVPGPGSASAAPPVMRANTNLEQVSDWLTKILLGATLVQVDAIATGVSNIANGLEQQIAKIGGLASLSGIGAILILLIVLFFAAGFLTLYLQTRTFLALMFVRAAHVMDDPKLMSAELDQLKEVAKQISIQGPTTPVPAAARELATRALGIAPADPTDVEALKQRGLAQVVLGQVGAGADTLKNASRLSGEADIVRLTSRLLAATDRPGEAKDLLRAMQTSPPTGAMDEAAVDSELTKMFVALYDHPPAGFTEALRVASILRDQPVIQQLTARQGRAQLYTAAAWGQKYAYSQNTVEAPALAEMRNAALQACRKALALDPTARSILRNMLEGKGQDDDLVSFKSDPEFQTLIVGS
jgi:hypothetical protein